jgi:hypothetical protein
LAVPVLVPVWAKRTVVHEPLDRRSHVFRTEVRAALHRRRCLPPARPLNGVEVHSFHGEAAGESVAEVVEAEVWNIGRSDGWPPVSLEVMQESALGGREDVGPENLLTLDVQQRLPRHAVQRHPPTITGLIQQRPPI